MRKLVYASQTILAQDSSTIYCYRIFLSLKRIQLLKCIVVLAINLNSKTKNWISVLFVCGSFPRFVGALTATLEFGVCDVRSRFFLQKCHEVFRLNGCIFVMQLQSRNKTQENPLNRCVARFGAVRSVWEGSPNKQRTGWECLAGSTGEWGKKPRQTVQKRGWGGGVPLQKRNLKREMYPHHATCEAFFQFWENAQEVIFGWMNPLAFNCLFNDKKLSSRPCCRKSWHLIHTCVKGQKFPVQLHAQNHPSSAAMSWCGKILMCCLIWGSLQIFAAFCS